MAKKKAKAKMKTEEKEKIDVRLRMDADLHERIQVAADQEGNSVAAFIRSTVVKELKRREKEDIGGMFEADSSMDHAGRPNRKGGAK